MTKDDVIKELFEISEYHRKMAEEVTEKAWGDINKAMFPDLAKFTHASEKVCEHQSMAVTIQNAIYHLKKQPEEKKSGEVIITLPHGADSFSFTVKNDSNAKIIIK